MENVLSLENITMLLQIADRIRKSVSPELRGENNLPVSHGKLTMIREAMQILSGYLPESHRIPFSTALKSCNSCCSTYISLKKHFRSLRDQQPGLDSFLTTLKVIMPMLEKRQRLPLKKAASMLEALHD